jgi:hypothetical protein
LKLHDPALGTIGGTASGVELIGPGAGTGDALLVLVHPIAIPSRRTLDKHLEFISWIRFVVAETNNLR